MRLDSREKTRLWQSLALAIAIESAALAAVAVWVSPRSGGEPRGSNWITVELEGAPVFAPRALVAPKPLARARVTRIAAASTAAPTAKLAAESRGQRELAGVSSGSGGGEGHGPIAWFRPTPKIPRYLAQEDFRKDVLIEFSVNASGDAHPRLIDSSGSDDLDRLAMDAARKWKFHPAVSEGHSVDSSLRLRISFQVI